MAQAWRLNPWDFRVRSATIERYGEARVPPDSTVEDWPLSYAELEPFYDRVEYAIGVSGKAGNLDGQLDPGGNIFEGPRSRDYPMPALRRTSFMDRMVEAGRSLNWNPFTGPAAITSQPYQGRPACVYHGYCMGAGCHVEAKSSPAVSTIPRALNTGRLNLVTEAHVTTIETDAQGRVRGVNYIRDGQEFFQPAEVVLLASYTYENVRLLLISGSAAYPEGLGNRSGQVGRHYFSHAQFGGVSALFPFDLENWYGTPGQGIALDDWADDNFDHTNLEFIGGGNLYVYTERRPMAAVNGAGGWAPPGTPNWGSAWKAHVMRTADRTHNAYIQRTTLPYAGNYLDLDPTARDRLGYPVVRLTASFRDNERNMGPVHGSGRHRGPGQRRTRQRHGCIHPRLWRDPDGREPDHVGPRPVGLLARGAEPGDSRRIRHGVQRGPEPHTYRPGSGLAHGRASRLRLGSDRRLSRDRDFFVSTLGYPTQIVENVAF
jgi:gluconate 2-dehydrogenase alpha chain